MIDIPSGWKFLKQELLTPYFCLIVSPDENVFGDISWSPENNPDGTYICRVIDSRAWEEPIAYLETENLQQACVFLEKFLSENAATGLIFQA